MFYKIFFVIFSTCFLFAAAADDVKRWEPLAEGDRVAIIAPSTSPSSAAVAKAVQLIQDAGFKPLDLLDADVKGDFDRSEIGIRRDHLLKALRSDAKVIWAIRGGRGASEIFEKEELFKEFLAKPKLLIGFSDFTVFHLWAAKMRWPSLHGIVLSYCKENQPTVNAKTSIENYFKVIKGETRELVYDLTPENSFAREANIEGPIVGGNLSLIQRSFLTWTQLDLRGGIFFMEDIGEVGSRLFEVLEQIVRSSLLDEVKGVIWGNFASDDPTEIAKAKRQFLQKIEEKRLPVFSADYFGHGPKNEPLPFNTRAVIEPGAS